MRKVLLAALGIGILFALVAIGYLVWSDRVARIQQVPLPERVTSTPLIVATSTITEVAEDYSIDAEYPRFGIANIDARIQSYVVEGVAALKNQATEDEPAKNQFPQYEYFATFSVAYSDDAIVSVRMVTNRYTGGAHGMPVIFGANFDRASGRELTLEDALRVTGMTLPQISVQTKAQLKVDLGDDILDISGADASEDNYQAFYITRDHVMFIFQPYQVAPYSAGAPEVSFARVR